MSNWGAILMEEGKLEDAISFLEQSIQIRKQLGNDPGSISSLRRLALAHMLGGKLMLAGKLSLQVMIRYMQLGILSRQRVVALARDFLAGTVRAVFQRGSGNKTRSVMESFSRTLVRPHKHQPLDRLDP
jgi:hypothetical protein